MSSPLTKPRILIVDDDPADIETAKLILHKDDYIIDSARSGEEAIRRVWERRNQYSVALIDFKMDKQNGAETTKEILKLSPNIKIFIYSSVEDRESMRAAWKSGALDFIDKSIEAENLRALVKKWVEIYEKEHRTLALEHTLSERSRLIRQTGMVGQSKLLYEICKTVQTHKAKPSRVIIIGAAGTGKERIARGLADPKEPFIAVNCARFNGNVDLMSKELFGNLRGAFTDAKEKTLGIFRSALKGTVFLDEIHHLNKGQQEILLRALQESEEIPVGGTKAEKFHCRVIAAAQPDIHQMRKDGRFRDDLYYRLQVKEIIVPPLNARPEDIAPLILYFAHKAATKYKLSKPKQFQLKAVQRLESYPWPGNVRELEHEIEKLTIEVGADIVKAEDLDVKFFAHSNPRHKRYSKASQEKAEKAKKEYVISLLFEKKLSERAAARRLGIPIRTFQRRLKEWKIESPRKRRRAK